MKDRAILFGMTVLAITELSFASVLPKDILSIKDSFDKNGATSCSQVLGETLHFIVKGRPITYSKQWSTVDTNKRPISIDFLISGTKDDYSTSGAIVLTPVGNKCHGAYVYSFVAPSENCKTYIQKAGFDSADWVKDIVEPNGDGGAVYFLSTKNSNNLNFILNDVAGGCAFTKRETLQLDTKK